MESSTIIAAILRAINDHTVVHPYGDGLLVDLPLTYSDGDAVRVLVEPMGDGFRVTDRSTAAELLTLAGVSVAAGRPAQAFASAVRASGLNNIGAGPGELATFGTAEELGSLVLAVAQTSIRVEQLRVLAVRQPVVRFHEQVTTRVRQWAAAGRQVRRDAPIQLRSGRTRVVTVRVSGGDRSAYVQAVSRRDPEHSAEHCYYLFGNSTVDPSDRIAALDGRADDWPAALIAEVASISDVQFFGEPLGLERRLEARVPQAARSGQ